MEHVAKKTAFPLRTAPITGLLSKVGRSIAAAAVISATCLSASSSPVNAAAARVYVVQNDRGGYISDRLRELRNLEASGRRVEIRGQICYSTCTMLLGLPNTCVSPHTQFGFHGPSKNGQRLSPDRFDFYSRVIAQYYPPKLNAWYIKTGRNKIDGIYRISGRDIIRMGVQAC